MKVGHRDEATENKGDTAEIRDPGRINWYMTLFR